MKTLTLILATALAGVISLQAATTHVLATGGKKGINAPAGVIFAKTAYKTGLRVKVINSQGSVHNISLAKHGHNKHGKISLFIANPSVFDKFKNKINFEKVGFLHTEYVHIVCNKESGVTSIHDLESGDKTIATGFAGSDNKIIFENWQKEDDDYKSTTTVSIGSTFALESVISGEVDCTMFNAGLGSKTMQELDVNSKKLRIIKVDDWDFDDYKDSKGRHPYFVSDIPKGTYKNLQAGKIYGSNATKTIAMHSALYMRKDLPEITKDQIRSAYKLSVKKIRKKYGYVKN